MSLYNTPFLNHINEIKYRFLYSFLSYIITVVILYLNIDNLLYFIIKPLLNTSYKGEFIYTNLIEIVYLYLKVSFISSLFFTIPLFLYQIYNFFSLGLYIKEKYLFRQLCIYIYLIYNIILILYYKYLLPFLWTFLLTFQIQNKNWDISLYSKITEYFNLFYILYFFTFILILLPTLVLFIFKNDIYDSINILKNRIIVNIFFIVVILTLSPPDFISQVSIYIPAFIMYEIILIKFINQTIYLKTKLNEKDGIRTHGINKK